MSSTAATQASQTGTSATSGGAAGATGGQSATASGGAGQSATGAQSGETKPRPSALADGDAGASAKGGEQGQTGTQAKDGKGATEGELEIKLPDGVEIDAESLAAFKGAAKEAGISGEQASKLAAWDAQRQAQAIDATVEEWQKQDDQWVAELKADKDFGGDKLDATRVAAQRAVRALGGQQLVSDIVAHGIGNLPSLVRAFAKMGLTMAEDKSSAGKGSGDAARPPTRDEKLARRYPNSQPKARAG